jgi:hypothetical protein
MTTRALHRALGITMLLPLLAWAVTGAIFFIKPGYGGAYESLAVRTLPITAPLALTPPDGWREIRYLRTILGEHLLARTDKGWVHVDPSTLQPKAEPGETDIRTLVTDAITANAARYGQITAVDGTHVTTSTGARITLDWNRMSLSQRGRDTDRIDAIYSVHYLQWTGVVWLDRILGGVGLVLLVGLTIAGVRLLTLRRSAR